MSLSWYTHDILIGVNRACSCIKKQNWFHNILISKMEIKELLFQEELS